MSDATPFIRPIEKDPANRVITNEEAVRYEQAEQVADQHRMGLVWALLVMVIAWGVGLWLWLG